MYRKLLNFLTAFSLLLMPVLAQSGDVGNMDKPARFTATAIGTKGFVGGQTIQLDLIVKRWTTDEEVERYANLLRERGPDALRSEMEDIDIGRVGTTGRIGSSIAIARMVDVGNGQTAVRIITTRTIPFFELYYSGRSLDYPYGVFDFTLNANGKAKKGGIIVAAKIQFDKNDRLEFVTYGLEPLELRNIKRIN